MPGRVAGRIGRVAGRVAFSYITLDMCQVIIIEDGIPLVNTSNTVECIHKPVSVGDNRYCKGLCKGQGQFEGQTCSLAGINVDTNETISIRDDCDLQEPVDVYSTVLGPFGK